MKAIIHATYGKTRLFSRALMGAGFEAENALSCALRRASCNMPSISWGSIV